MEVTIAQIAAAVGTTTGLVGLVTLAVRHGRVLQRLDAVEEKLRACATATDMAAVRAALEESVTQARWIDHTQHFSERLRDLRAEIDRVSERLHDAETRAATWPPVRPTGP